MRRLKLKSHTQTEFSLADAITFLHAPRMHRWLPALLIIALLAGFRVLGSTFPESLPNINPLPAVFLCCLIFLKGHQRWALPLAIWLLTDPITSLLQGYPIFGWHHLSIALGIAATVAIARFTRRNPTPAPVLLAAAASAAAFYFLTNLVSFAGDPLYAKTFEGFVQSQWTGPVGLGPTWVFLRNLLVGNLAFTSLYLLARQSLPQASAATTAVAAR